MRSTNIIVFLILLNAATMVMTAALGPGFDLAPEVGGDAEIQEAQNAQENLQASRSALDAFVSGIVMTANYLLAIKDIVFIGPEMFRALGTPDVIVTGVESVIAVIFGMDLAEIISGRRLS